MFTSQAASEKFSAVSSGAKMLDPGLHTVRILEMTLKPASWDAAQSILSLTIEAPSPGDDFEGMARDKTNPGAGNYEGPVAYVNAQKFPFKDWPARDGKPASAAGDQIWRWLTNFSEMIGVKEQVTAARLEASTIQDYFNMIRPYLVNPMRWVNICVAGEEYEKDGRKQFKRFIPYAQGTLLPVTLVPPTDCDPITGVPKADIQLPANQLPFDPGKHITHQASAPAVAGFAGAGAGAPASTDDILPF